MLEPMSRLIKRKGGGGVAMRAQGKEGHPYNQPCCATKFGEEVTPITDLFLL